MKKVMDGEERRKWDVHTYISKIKTIIHLFKQCGLNNHLQNGHIIQKVESRSATAFDIFDCSLRCAEEFRDIMREKHATLVKSEFRELQIYHAHKDEIRVPSLNVDKEAFLPVLHVQKQLKAKKHPRFS